MDKQKVSDELTKLVQLNKDSLAEIKSDNQDIYNAMLNVILAIDKKFGADDFLSYVQLDEEITTGGGMPSSTEVNAESKPPTPPAPPKPPKPKAPTMSGRPKLLNLLGSNDPDGFRKMYTFPSGYRVEYDTSTLWSEDWSMQKGWRPSPQRSAGGSKSDAVGYGADGNWYEIKTDKNKRQSWVKMKLGSINDLDTLKKYIAKMSEEDIALLVDQKRFYLASTDRDEDEDIYEELDSELAKILGFLESNGYDKYSNS